MSKPLAVNRLGDTLHTGLIYHAALSAGLLPEAARELPMLSPYTKLFEGASFIPVASATATFGDGRKPWTGGPTHNQHVRDKMAWLYDLSGLDLAIYLPMAQPVPTDNTVVFCPHAHPGQPYKEWAPANWLSLVEEARGLGFKPIATGNPPGNHRIQGLDYMPYYPAHVLAHRLAAAAAIVSVDTGIVHLADAMGNPPIGLYGATSTVAYGPYIDKSYCVDHHRTVFERGNAYDTSALNLRAPMRSIHVDHVVAQLRRRLSPSRRITHGP